mmetsp:Transcript_3821/g.9324  ORF Transcript_3821/g.9324 Transcript_3821/m.9324 type:complete len:263 (-) Transcript_3821:1183-1971(-)
MAFSQRVQQKNGQTAEDDHTTSGECLCFFTCYTCFISYTLFLRETIQSQLCQGEMKVGEANLLPAQPVGGGGGVEALLGHIQQCAQEGSVHLHGAETGLLCLGPVALLRQHHAKAKMRRAVLGLRLQGSSKVSLGLDQIERTLCLILCHPRQLQVHQCVGVQYGGIQRIAEASVLEFLLGGQQQTGDLFDGRSTRWFNRSATQIESSTGGSLHEHHVFDHYAELLNIGHLCLCVGRGIAELLEVVRMNTFNSSPLLETRDRL